MKTLRRLVFLGAAALLQAGCGLPDTYFLQPPSPGILAPGNGWFEFSNPIHDANHDINATFLGNELYYKFYADSTVDKNAYDPNNPSDASVQLLAKGFFPVCLSTDQSPNRSVPLIAIDSILAAAGSTVVVNVQPAFASTLTNYVLETDPPAEIRRKAPEPLIPSDYKTFQDNQKSPPHNFAINDPDIGLTLYNQMNLSGLTYVVMYAISYGETIGNQTPVRSSAIYLGYLSFTFFP